jgi:hypothetical protein
VVRAREYDHIAGRISHGEHALERIIVRTKEPHGRIHVYKSVDGYAGGDDGSPFVDKAIMAGARELAASAGGITAQMPQQEVVLSGPDGEKALVLAALSEVLRQIEASFAAGRLSFDAAFRTACEGVAAQFSFMQGNEAALVYRKGEITLNTEAETKIVAEAVFAALRPIFAKLRNKIKYAEILRDVSDRLIEISAERRTEFAQLGLIDNIERLLAEQ